MDWIKCMLRSGNFFKSRLVASPSFSTTALPKSVDWRKEGAVRSVKNQGGLGINYIITKKLESLSVQQIIDGLPLIQGVCLGDPVLALRYILENGGIVADKEYPYLGRKREIRNYQYVAGDEYKKYYSYLGWKGECLSSKIMNLPHVTIDGFKSVPRNEHALMKAVARQPVIVSIDSKHQQFLTYKEGIVRGCGKLETYHDLDHTMTIVGYDTSPSGEEYWIVKNSYGCHWGENGYVYMLRGVGPTGLYGIAEDAWYPTKISANTDQGPKRQGRILTYPLDEDEYLYMIHLMIERKQILI